MDWPELLEQIHIKKTIKNYKAKIMFKNMKMV